jgi:hypothetical protein
MTRLAITTLPTYDPGPEAHSAKNAPTGPGLPDQPEDHSERPPMVGAETTTTQNSRPVPTWFRSFTPDSDRTLAADAAERTAR